MSVKKPVLYHVPFDSVPYQEALRLQEQVIDHQRAGVLPDLLLTLEHPPTITIGVSGSLTDLHVDNSLLRSKGIEVVRTNRGGKTTYHCPGQLVVYPLIDLKRHGLTPHGHLRLLEEVAIRVLTEWNVTAAALEGRTGVWIEDRKIASIGIRLRRGRTMHGIAINLAIDLTPFSLFIPCGMQDVAVTSLECECGRTVDRERVRRCFVECFAEQLGMDLQRLSPTELALP